VTTTLLLAGLVLVALLLQTAWQLLEKRREHGVSKRLDDLAEMGDLVPESIHPFIDPTKCIGSGSCVRACPEKTVLAVAGGAPT